MKYFLTWLLLLLLVSCRSITIDKSPKGGITTTSTPTTTQINTQFIGPSLTPRPSATLTYTPLPNFYEGIAPTLNEFTPITRKQQYKLIAYLFEFPSLIDQYPTGHDYSIEVRDSVYYDGVEITCFYEESCIIRASIEYFDYDSWGTYKLLIWEFRDSDGTHRLIKSAFGDIWSHYAEQNPQKNGTITQLAMLHKINKGQKVKLTIVTSQKTITEATAGQYRDIRPITNNARRWMKRILNELREPDITVLPNDIERMITFTIITI